MQLTNPIIITSRLLPGVRIGDVEISLRYAGQAGRDGRTRYRYFIDGPDFEHSDNDLQSGCQGGGLQEGLESLLTFLGAAAESYGYRLRTQCQGENEDLFPAEVVQWAYQHNDEISMLALELEETKNLIEE